MGAVGSFCASGSREEDVELHSGHHWDFVSDSLSSGRRIKCLSIADDFSHQCVDIELTSPTQAVVSHLCIRLQSTKPNRAAKPTLSNMSEEGSGTGLA